MSPSTYIVHHLLEDLRGTGDPKRKFVKAISPEGHHKGYCTNKAITSYIYYHLATMQTPYGEYAAIPLSTGVALSLTFKIILKKLQFKKGNRD